MDNAYGLWMHVFRNIKTVGKLSCTYRILVGVNIYIIGFCPTLVNKIDGLETHLN